MEFLQLVQDWQGTDPHQTREPRFSSGRQSAAFPRRSKARLATGLYQQRTSMGTLAEIISDPNRQSSLPRLERAVELRFRQHVHCGTCRLMLGTVPFFARHQSG